MTYTLCGKPIQGVSVEKTNLAYLTLRTIKELIEDGREVIGNFRGKLIRFNDYNIILNTMSLKNDKGSLYFYDTVDDNGVPLVLNVPVNEEECLLYYTFQVPKYNQWKYYDCNELVNNFDSYYNYQSTFTGSLF